MSVAKTIGNGMGFEVAETDSAKHALDMVALRDDIDLLFTDVVSPGGGA